MIYELISKVETLAEKESGLQNQLRSLMNELDIQEPPLPDMGESAPEHQTKLEYLHTRMKGVENQMHITLCLLMGLSSALTETPPKEVGKVGDMEAKPVARKGTTHDRY